MEKFRYVRAASVSEAVAFLNEPGLHSRPLAGGTDLLLLLRSDPDLCDQLVDISLVADLHRIEQKDGVVSIGAASTFCEVFESSIVKRTAPVLAQACSQVGAVQIRNMGTIGGNVINAAACADSLPALVCLGAKARILTPHGEISMPVSELVIAPNRTRIPTGGLLVSLDYEVPPAGSRSVFIKLGRRNAMAISRLTVAALGRLDNQRSIEETRLVPGAAAPQTVRFNRVEDYLLGNIPTKELFVEAAKLAADEMIRLAGRRWSSEYKEMALASMTIRALEQVFPL
jgi:CO/xanthine dehydrogenase FAD-binding subunit